jgi:thioredoxin-dependent peroxiredoxin
MPAASSIPALPERSDLIPAGETAPDFEATDHQGQHVRLRNLLEKGRVVLVFYPKDNTLVCTKQLCALRDDWSKFQERKVAVLGINPAGKDSHAAFALKHGFPFPVLVDQDSRIAGAYGAGGMLLTKRTVYVIDRDGKVLLAEGGVVPHEHIFAALDRR